MQRQASCGGSCPSLRQQQAFVADTPTPTGKRKPDAIRSTHVQTTKPGLPEGMPGRQWAAAKSDQNHVRPDQPTKVFFFNAARRDFTRDAVFL